MSVISKSYSFLPQTVIPEFVGTFSLSFNWILMQLRTPGSIILIRLIRFTESIALINTNTINPIDLIYWHCRPHQNNCTTVVSFFCLPDWLSYWVLFCYIQCHIVGTFTFDSYFDSVYHSILQWYPHHRWDFSPNKKLLIVVYLMANSSFLYFYY